MKVSTRQDHASSIGRWLLLIGLIWIASVDISFANDRVALVVGNSKYPHNLLLNTKNDATDMADLLEKAGFKVGRQIDTNLGQLQEAVDRFGAAIRDPKVKFGFFYYAGHGLQLDWHNYLMPVSANIRNPTDIALQTVDVSRLLQYMEQAVGRNFLVVLDACRDDPFEGEFRPAAKGLSQFDAPVGSLLAFSTAPGKTAADGQGKNGLYTGNLLREFAVPGARVEDAFKRVRLNVRLASKGAQIPWESTSLEEDISIFPLATRKLSEADRDKLLEKEMTAWLRIKGSNDPEVLAGFIREYPSGSASELALSRMNRMLAAMAAQEGQRLQNVANNAAQKTRDLAALEETARKLALQAQVQLEAAAKTEAERIRLAQLEAEHQRALVKQAEQAVSAKAESARLARERALAAEQEAERLATAKKETERQNELKAQAALAEKEQLQARRKKEAEEARMEQMRQAAAKAEVERIRVAQLESERKRALVLQAAEEQQAAQAESARLAAIKMEAERQSEFKAQAALAEQERLLAQQRQLAEEVRMEQQRLADLQQRQAEREANAAALAKEQEARRLAAIQLEQAWQSELQAQAAAVELQRLAAMQAEKESRERDLAANAQRDSEELAAQAAKQQLEVTRLAAERQTLLATTQSLPAPETLSATPFFKGSNEHVRHFSVGDQATIEVIDELTKIAKRKVMKVTGADTQSDRITYNNGEYVSDLMGNTTVNQLGSFSTPRQFYPAELFVGNKWHTRFKQSRPNGLTYTFQYDLKVVGKEKITVPAGTFEAYKIEARGFNLELNASLERNIWVTPGINADIAHETRVRLRNGNINQYDREELVSFVQAVQ